MKAPGRRVDEILARLPLGKPLRGAEIGVWTGDTSWKLLFALEKLVMFCIDPWERQSDESSYVRSGDLKAPLDQETFGRVEKIARSELGQFGERAQVLKLASLDAASLLWYERFDFVFIDGDHSYEGVSTDIGAWWPLVKPGGWIGGHDYGHPLVGDVKRAVDEVFDEIELGGDRTWFAWKEYEHGLEQD